MDRKQKITPSFAPSSLPTKSYLKQYAEATYERGFEEEYKDFVQVCLEDGFVANEDDYETYLDFYDSCK